MGSGIIVHCESCEYKKEFYLGLGMMYSSLENVIDCVDHWRRAEVLEILQNHKVEKRSYEHKLYGCMNCAGLYAKFYVKIDYNGGKVYETDFMCGKCKSGLVEIKDVREVENRPCPKCKQKTLCVEESILWD
jgi:hypothetical protein